MHKNLCIVFFVLGVYPLYYSRISKTVMLKAWDVTTKMSPGLLQREKRVSELGSWVYLLFQPDSLACSLCLDDQFKSLFEKGFYFLQEKKINDSLGYFLSQFQKWGIM